jgi:hypothetical protein
VKLEHRIQNLERLDALAHPPSPMDRFQRALNEAAIRLTGKRADLIGHDITARALVMDDLKESFVRKLNDADLASLITEMERIVSENSTAGLVPEGSPIGPMRELGPRADRG